MKNPIVLAFSGGLDTSYCIPWLKETLGCSVVTVTVDTGGMSDSGPGALETLALALGAEKHISIDARHEYFDAIIRYLIFGNVRKGGTYPLSVGAERSIQAAAVARTAASLGASFIAHGCTAAGNDQVRFETTLRTLYPEIEILAPVRDHPIERSAQVAFLEARSLPVPSHGAAYSINRGLWGTTIGGSETLSSESSIPEHAWPLSAGAFDAPSEPSTISVGFESGVPSSIDGIALDPVSLIEHLDERAASYGVGRGIHLGDTIPGIKGRVAYEAPAAEVILTAHRELEKLVLSGNQLSYKSFVGQWYGELVHAGKLVDPVCRDLESFLMSSQDRVTGTVHVTLSPGNVFVTGCESPFSLMDAGSTSYGETAREWSAADAAGFCKIMSVAPSLYELAGKSSIENEVTR